jgi:fused signal recognition particle receptor
MSDEKEKVGLFRRWFGLGKKSQDEEAARPEDDVGPTQEQELSADGDFAEQDRADADEAVSEAAHDLTATDEATQPAGSEPAADAAADTVADTAEAVEGEVAVAAAALDEPAPEAEDDADKASARKAVVFLSEKEAEAEEPAEDAKPVKKSWFQRLREGLRKSSQSLGSGITDIFTKRKLDDDTIQDLEDILIQADLGIDAAMRISQRVGSGRYNKLIEPEEVKRILAAEVAEVLRPVARPLQINRENRPFVIMMVGVNGSGKTTTIGKLAAQFRHEGRKVILAAGDTFRAAAVEQLKVWGERVGAPVLSKDIGADAAGLAFEAMQKAKAENADILMIDTAGRLQNKTDLMAELQKIVRVLRKQDETAPHAVLLVLDATTGQNAVNQVEIFQKTAGVTGLIMTKLDGTARGGILVAVAEKFGLPIHAIGVGEGIDDLQPFEADEFARSIAGLN